MNLLFVGIALLALILLCSFICYYIAFYSPMPHKYDPYELPEGDQYNYRSDYMFSLIKEFEDLPFERVEAVAYDGKILSGRYYHVKDGAPMQIQFHGYRGSGLRDFCGGNKLARNMGQNTLVVDQRSQGSSQGRTICFGIKEQHDCISWINYACCRFGDDIPIILSGVSMGAATVLMAAAHEDLPENVKGVLADSPFSSPVSIIRKVCAEQYPAWLVWPFIVLGARIFGNLNIYAASAEEAVKKAKIPALIIHGEEDLYVPCEMSRFLAENYAMPVRLETFPHAGHGLSFIWDEERYKKATEEFVASIL